MQPSGEKRQEMAREQEAIRKVADFVEKDGGKPAKKFLDSMEKVQQLLQGQKEFFANYLKSRQRLEEFGTIKNRKPASENLTQLNLDINPSISKAKQEPEKTKRQFYEAIRSSETDLHLSTSERAQLLSQIVEWCETLGIQIPPLETILFPDMAYSMSEEDLKNPQIIINFNPVESSITLNRISGPIRNAYVNKYEV